jgi:hypothetical protein
MSVANVKSLTDAQIEAGFKQIEQDAKELRAEVQRRANMTPAQRLADRIHRLLHTKVDCDYAYSDWGGTLTSCRAEYLSLAERLLQFDDIRHIVMEMEKARFGPSYVPPAG